MHGCSWGVHGCSGGACMVLFGGACMVLFGGHVWFYSGGCAWFYSGGVHGFIWGGVHGFFSFFGYNEIRSMSGRYASYWNALFSCRKSLRSRKSFVLGELSFARMSLQQYCLSMNKLHCYN